MELEVKLVAGIDNCFVSLPLILIQTLQSSSQSRSALLREVLALELRSRTNDDRWVVAWSGATSSSSAIEIAQQFAECISLGDRTRVQVRALSNVPKATLVTIEPNNEDDWEVLELNSEVAEAAILKQVRFVHESMRFPLWLHGRTSITFLVTSTFPKKAILSVQLVAGTEVAVAPKRRKQNVDSNEDSYMLSSNREHVAKALLVAVVPRSPSKERAKNSGNDALRVKGSSKEANTGTLSDKKEYHQAIVRLLTSDSVARGHVMIAHCLRLYLRVSLHSWVYLKGCNVLKKDVPSLSLSPCCFKMSGKDKAFEKMALKHFIAIRVIKERHASQDWFRHLYGDFRMGLQILLNAWFLAQLDAISSHTGVEVNSLILGRETLLHFVVKDSKFRAQENVHASCNGTLENGLMVLLSPASGMWFSFYSLPLPGHVLIYGPPGSGKTLLARAVAKSLQEHEGLLAHIVFVSCSRLSLEKTLTIRQALSGYISEALDHAPSIVILDDEKRKISCGIGPLAFIACAQSLESIPQSLSSSGRFDFHVQLPAPAATERAAILKHEIQKRCLQCSDSILLDIASKCDGYDAYDLEILVDRTVHAAVGRFLPYLPASDKHEKPTLNRDDFSRAMQDFLPVAMRDITKSAPEGVGLGGMMLVVLLTFKSPSKRFLYFVPEHPSFVPLNSLVNILNFIGYFEICKMIEFPSKFPNIFAKAPLRLRSNVLLYGPPGCGKTHIVGAAAAACSLRFISVKGPELLNKYIGASEQAVRDIFSKAAAAAPCLLFFDEFDSIAPKRGHDNTGVTDRVVNQFLTELDGVEVLTGVFVFAATSRPDLLDAALLRPGRLDRLLYCGFPSERERLDILTVLSRKLPLASDVDLASIACMTEGFSGADLQALLSDAQLAAVHELLSANKNEAGKNVVITNALLKSTASKARPSVSKPEKERLDGIYRQFLDSKRPVAEQTRDSKGKRATLA
ncbi:hypothetical protein FNV43_RR18515 [Rhamnella rubrinervis]|uniref:Peroxisomal ATPase PEX1 n=1 Tax=Rhamnella rubrinervis TaxID=2594499 RepID=A0A8K0GT02_9ROSA|nr:hypothetical protein FNV43_RR18515 [Rhamnella rubrinervis]